MLDSISVTVAEGGTNGRGLHTTSHIQSVVICNLWFNGMNPAMARNAFNR